MSEIPHGYCHCGCDQKTKIVGKTALAEGRVKGEPNKFLKGHHTRLRPKPQDYVVEDRGYETPCWIWVRFIRPDGYGRARFKGKTSPSVLAHRHYYERFVGPIPEGLYIDHLCRVRECVNPEHLEPVTNRENILRGEGMGAKHARRTHCAEGHELAGNNLYVNPASGARYCHACRREARKAA